MTLPNEWFRWNELSKIEQDHIVRLVNHIASCPEEYNHILLTNIENLRKSTKEQHAKHMDDWIFEDGPAGLTD